MKPEDHPEGSKYRCGTCQWFAVGFRGEACQKNRGVEVDTTACIEYKAVMQDPYKEIVTDKYITGIRSALVKLNKRCNYTAITEELRNYQMDIDKLKNKFGSTQDLEGIDKLLRMIISYRDRVTAVYTELLELNKEYDELTQHANMWLHSKYAIMRDLKNEAARKAATDRILPELIGTGRNITTLITTTKFMNDKINDNEFTLRAILSASEKLWFSQNAKRMNT
jgi:endonuclease/exonuclease/phosphatase family metal-dependent hydrolase